MLCRKCGAENPDDMELCAVCGANLYEDELPDHEEIDFFDEEEPAAQEQNNEAPEVFDENEIRRQNQMDRMMEEKKQQLEEIEQRRQEKRRRQKRNRILTVALLVVLILGAVGAGVYFFASGGLSGNQTVIATPTPEAATQTPFEAPTPAATGLPEDGLQPSPSIYPDDDPAPDADSGGSSAQAPAGSAAPDSASSNNSPSWRSTNQGGSSSSSSTSSSGTGSSKPSTSSGHTSGSQANNGASGSSSSGNNSGGNSGTSSVVVGSNGKINSQLIYGGEVLYNKATGSYLMSFKAGDKTYYANVSEGSTTEQIKNKPFTISADPTDKKYNGNTVYEINIMTNYSGTGYILPDSGTKLLTSSELGSLSKDKLSLARNEIYARHGRKFQRSEYQAYFEAQPWYQENPSYNYEDDNSNLNNIEKQNVALLLDAERRR